MRGHHIRDSAVDHAIAPGVYPDMTEHGFATEEWPALYERVMAADILVIAGPIWLGDNGSVTRCRDQGVGADVSRSRSVAANSCARAS